MKYLVYIFGILLAVLSLFWFDAYLVNHPYYFSMLSNFSYWMIVLLGLLVAFLYVIYFFSSKSSFAKKLMWLFVSFIVFSWILGSLKGGFGAGGQFVLILNYLIIFSFIVVLLIGSLSIGDLILKKISFEKGIYEFAIKLGFGFSVFAFLLYFIVSLGFLYSWVAWLIFAGLLALILYNKGRLGNIFVKINEDFEKFSNYLAEKKYLKYALIGIFSVSLWYIFVGFNYTFIPYPTAWDANHAYMFIPRVFGIYNGYPWSIDFRPDMYIWYAFLAWVYKLGSWTWFAPDTWMIVFNFLSGVFSLFFGFMLISTIVKFVSNTNDNKNISKADIVLVLGYILILARLTSGNGAFLVFVDNKTDLAVFMFVALALFLALYSLWQLKLGNISKKQILIFVALSGFFFAVANLIKPTATFDFFETTLVFTILEIGILLVLAMILFVVGLLALLNFRGFDKAISPAWSKTLFGLGFVLGVADTVYAFFRKRFKLFVLITFIASFLGVVILAKGTFGLIQYCHGEKLVTNPVKLGSSLIMASKLPTQPKAELTGALYKDLKKVIGSSYKEDNGRYMGYGSRNFGNVWWSFIVPSNFKEETCVGFSTAKCENKVNLAKNQTILNNLVLKIYNNKSDILFNDYVNSILSQAEKTSSLQDLAKKMNLQVSGPDWQIKKQIKEKLAQNIQNQTLLQIKQALLSGNLDFNKLPGFLNTSANQKLLKQLTTSGYIITSVSIPYKYLVPFNEVFNWSLQNLSSYYTDIGIIWLILFIIVIYAFVYSIHLMGKGFVRKQSELIYQGKLIFAFSFATLIGWAIWYFVASGIIWYNVGGIIWLIITTLIFLNKWEDKYILPAVIFIVAVSGIFLNLIRIASQGGGAIQNWYRGSVGYVYNYKISQQGIQPQKELKVPYTFDDVFHLQFNMYKKPIKAIDARTKDQMAIIGGTYMRYFVKNQNKILGDQFLMWLWRMGSDNNVENTYKRFKDNNLKDIVIDPNIATVVMGTGNISLWYRYYGKVDKQGNLTEKGVLPTFVDLATKGYLEYGFTNNLGIKYALTVSDDEFTKATGISDKNEIKKLRYYLTSFRFFPRDIAFSTKDKKLGQQMYNKAIDVFYKLITYRLQKALKGDTYEFASDLMDVNGYYIPNLTGLLSTGITPEKFDKLSIDEKSLLIQLMNILNTVASNPSATSKVLQPIIQNGIASRAQLLFVKVK